MTKPRSLMVSGAKRDGGGTTVLSRLTADEKYNAEGNLPEAARWYRKSLELTIGDEWPAVLVRKWLKEIEEKLKTPAQAPAKADGR